MADTIQGVKNATRKVQQVRQDLYVQDDELPNKVTAWRNSIDLLQRELEAHAASIEYLRNAGDESGDNKTLKFRNTLKNVLEKLAEDYKQMWNLLQEFTHFPNDTQFEDWDMILMSLRQSLAEASKKAITEGPEEALQVIESIYIVRDQLLAQILQSLLLKKVLLWMDLDIKPEEYAKGEILDITQRLISFYNHHGYYPTKFDYIHPQLASQHSGETLLRSKRKMPKLFPQLIAFSEAYIGVLRLLENNFNLQSKSSKNQKIVISLREEVEIAKRDRSQLERELSVHQAAFRNPDKREWVSVQKEKAELINGLHIAEMNVKRLEMEKGTLETDNIRLNQELQDIRERLNRLSSDVLPRLTRIEETHRMILDELKNIRQDAELLPGMFRKEALMKNTIREESIKAIEAKNKAEYELQVQTEKAERLQMEKSRKEKIALQAIAARNTMQSDLERATNLIEQFQKQKNDSDDQIKLMREKVEKFKQQTDELQNHVFVLNNRINELEDQKKVLMEQLHERGEHSKAHYTHRRLTKK